MNWKRLLTAHCTHGNLLFGKYAGIFAKGGRIGAVGALLGSLLGIRPVITLDKEGKLVVAAKCRTRSKVLNTMLEISSSHGELERICIAHEARKKMPNIFTKK